MVQLGELSFFARPHVGAPSVAEAVRTHVTVEKLSIEGDWFGDDDAEELGAALGRKLVLGDSDPHEMQLWCARDDGYNGGVEVQPDYNKDILEFA